MTTTPTLRTVHGNPARGRFWLAAKFALIALRRKRDRVGDGALTGKEKQALDR